MQEKFSTLRTRLASCTPSPPPAVLPRFCCIYAFYSFYFRFSAWIGKPAAVFRLAGKGWKLCRLSPCSVGLFGAKRNGKTEKQGFALWLCPCSVVSCRNASAGSCRNGTGSRQALFYAATFPPLFTFLVLLVAHAQKVLKVYFGFSSARTVPGFQGVRILRHSLKACKIRLVRWSVSQKSEAKRLISEAAHLIFFMKK